GIGSGMQLLNVSQGGTLFLHIPEDISKALPHRDTMDPYHRHGLTVLKDSLLARVYGDNEIRVNSRHHMAIDDVAPRFLVTARSPDKVIEAIEYMDDDWFAIGTQFHPETISATVLDQRIFVEFVRGVIDFKQQHKHTAAPSKHTIAAKEETKTGTKSVAAKKHEKSMPLFMDEPVTVKVSSRKYAAAKL
ncbi:MAG: gamma-glutamyl-gamma-aminobutyrate hydrolase family protein, partial [Thermoguttaceae bacterium]|nr:gamma-glutamyl-gamma-aminobutyrate hydrolase family protein [Thermoguttaceae bacterium]